MTQREAVWRRLQADYPDVVEVLTEVRRVFGKTPTPTIKLKGGVVWSPAIALREKRKGRSSK